MGQGRERLNHESAALVRKLWQYCNVLRDDGLSYPDYVEQLTYLLFLKMSDEQDGGPVPAEIGWRSLIGLDAEAMHAQYAHVLSELSGRSGMLRLIFHNARNKIKDPAKLRFLIADLIGQTKWTGLSADVKGDAYEGLLEKNARDTKSGAGQYFTPRPLIEAIVECVCPELGEVVSDPACGTGGFLLATYEYLRRRHPELTRQQQRHLQTKALRGVELVEEVARLAAMNLLLHGISGGKEEELPIQCADSLKYPPAETVDVVLTNPPFGVRGTVTYTSKGGKPRRSVDDLTVLRPDFWVQTANKQLNFLQHVVTMLKPGGRTAVIVPDNVLFEGGAAEAIRRRLLESCVVHTLLRLPTGLFYAQGVKANVLFFDRTEGDNRSGEKGKIWVYDLRSDHRLTLKTNPLRREHLAEFISVYCPGDRLSRNIPESNSKLWTRWRAFDIQELLGTRDCSLDLLRGGEQLPDRGSGLTRLEEISRLISDDLQRALNHISNAGSAGREPVDR
jgi:type I restriction enzyme M protein